MKGYLLILIALAALIATVQSASAYYVDGYYGRYYGPGYYGPIYPSGYYVNSWNYGWSGWGYHRINYRYHYPYSTWGYRAYPAYGAYPYWGYYW